MLFMAFDFYGNTELFENVVCRDRNERVIFQSNKSYDELQEIADREDFCLVSIDEYFQTLQSSDEFYLDDLRINIIDVIKYIFEQSTEIDILESYVYSLDKEVECLSSELTSLINIYVKKFLQHKIDSLQNKLNQLNINTMKWN